MPRRLRRAAARIERRRARPMGQLPPSASCSSPSSTGIIVGGQVGRLDRRHARRRRLRHRERRDHRPERDLRARRPGEARDRRLARHLRRRRRRRSGSRAALGRAGDGAEVLSEHARRCRSRSASPSRSGSATARSSSSTRRAREIAEARGIALRDPAVHGRRRARTSWPRDVPRATSRREPDVLEPDARRPCSSPTAAGTCCLEDGVTIKLPEKNRRAALAPAGQARRRAASSSPAT